MQIIVLLRCKSGLNLVIGEATQIFLQPQTWKHHFFPSVAILDRNLLPCLVVAIIAETLRVYERGY